MFFFLMIQLFCSAIGITYILPSSFLSFLTNSQTIQRLPCKLTMAECDLAELRKQCITSLYLCTDNVSKYLDAEKEEEFKKLKGYVKEYCLLEAQQEVAMQALERTKRETDQSNVEALEERFNAHLQTMAGRRLNVDNNPYMVELNNRIERGLQRDIQNMDESDLAITESQDEHIDPITKRPIVDPVKNTVCGHVYEKDSIINLIKRNQRTKCPVAGCGNRDPIKPQDLVSDEELKFRLTITQHSTMLHERSVTNID